MAPLPKSVGLPRGAADIYDFRKIARRKLPGFVFHFLDGGIGNESVSRRNRAALDAILLRQKIIEQDPQTASDSSVSIGGHSYDYPFAVAPVGLPGLICPGAERALARASARLNIPFCLSMMATERLEDLRQYAPETDIWFQLYWPRNTDFQQDLLQRAKNCALNTLMITVDIPAPQYRERAVRSGSNDAGKMHKMIAAALCNPLWAARMLKGPRPQFRNITPYVGSNSLPKCQDFIARECVRPISLEEIAKLRDDWPGKLIVKGILDAESARQLSRRGIDGLVVSNHGGRQLDAAPVPITLLPEIRSAIGAEMSLIADSGVENGLDILRMRAAGADFALMGKLPYLAIGAGGVKAAASILDLTAQQISGIMAQLGATKLSEVENHLFG